MLNEALRKLAQVQRIDTAIQELHRKFASLDPGGKAKQRFEEAKARKEQLEHRLSEIRGEIKDLELENSRLSQKSDSEKKRLYSGGVYNAKDAEAIDREVANLAQRVAKNDDRLLELYELVEPARLEADEAQQDFEAASRLYEEYTARYEAIKKDYESKMARLIGARNKAAAQCDEDLLTRYEAIRKHHHGVGIAPLHGDECGQCRSKIAHHIIADVQAGVSLQTCENCARILYWEEASEEEA